MKRNERWRVFIDRPVQGALVFRALVYIVMCLLTQQLIVFLYALVSSSSGSTLFDAAQLGWYIRLSVFAVLAILPVVLFDILKVSHRWVGPIFRLRASLRALRNGEPITPIQFRNGDYWQDIAVDFSAVAIELNRLRAASSAIDPALENPVANKGFEPLDISPMAATAEFNVIGALQSGAAAEFCKS